MQLIRRVERKKKEKKSAFQYTIAKEIYQYYLKYIILIY